MIKLTVFGANAGKTFNFRGFGFNNGVLVLNGSAAENDGVIKYLGRTVQAFPDGHERLENSNGERDTKADTQPGHTETVSSGIQPTGTGVATQTAAVSPAGGSAEAGSEGIHSEGSGQKDSWVDGLKEKVTAAAKKLDPKNDDHWSQLGKPMVAAMQQLSGIPTLTRRDIDNFLPGLAREKA